MEKVKNLFKPDAVKEAEAKNAAEAAESSPSTATGTTTTETPGSAPAPAAHNTFVRSGYNHEQHVGVDGPIGRQTEVSGLHGSDARKTSTVADIDPSLAQGTAEGKASSGDGNAPYPALVGEEGAQGSGEGITWEKIKKSDTPY